MRGIGFVASAGLGVALLTGPVLGHASSGSTWQVRVTNPTDVIVAVNVAYAKGTARTYWVFNSELVTAPGGGQMLNVPGA